MLLNWLVGRILLRNIMRLLCLWIIIFASWFFCFWTLSRWCLLRNEKIGTNNFVMYHHRLRINPDQFFLRIFIIKFILLRQYRSNFILNIVNSLINSSFSVSLLKFLIFLYKLLFTLFLIQIRRFSMWTKWSFWACYRFSKLFHRTLFTA